MRNAHQPDDLTARAIAVLCAMRQGPLNVEMARFAIGDAILLETHHLLGEMAEDGLIGHASGYDVRYYLTNDGVGWLQNHGLNAVPEARLLVAQERAS